MALIITITSFLLAVLSAVKPQQIPSVNRLNATNSSSLSAVNQSPLYNGTISNHSLQDSVPNNTQWSGPTQPDSLGKNPDGANLREGNPMFAEGQITADRHQTRIDGERTDGQELGGVTTPIHPTMGDKKFDELKSNVSVKSLAKMTGTTTGSPSPYLDTTTTEETKSTGDIQQLSTKFDEKQESTTEMTDCWKDMRRKSETKRRGEERGRVTERERDVPLDG
ncbi:hypothetical protein GWI33_005687 [Rhynchophorus ferrugineus]|uniref:Secreted protein n=1 Tax=Rhynchophorus ferrugineus TaxID=354439 RepID=A0A834MFV7_RHYFE|nr:hypothetical protein GWI33_005687 [Rhynchophorus ferrugineus]